MIFVIVKIGAYFEFECIFGFGLNLKIKKRLLLTPKWKIIL